MGKRGNKRAFFQGQICFYVKCMILIIKKNRKFEWSKGWRSDESARLPSMWPGFNSRRRRHMWVEFVVGSLLCSERFFSGYSGFPLSPKTSISKNQHFQIPIRLGIRSTKNHFVDVLPPNYYLFIIYLFIYLFIFSHN